MSILITGSAGFIGSHLSELLLSQNNKVIGVDNFDNFYSKTEKENNLENSLSHSNFTFYEGDLRNKLFLNKIFSKHKIDIVIHLAARAGVRPSIEDPHGYFSSNIEATLSLLEVMREFNVKKMSFASSSSVYGKNLEVPFHEKQNLDTFLSPYAYTKKSCEDLLKLYFNMYQFSVHCLRLFTVYGPRQRPDLAIHKFIKKLYQSESIEVYGEGQLERDFTYVDDIVSGITSSAGLLLRQENPEYEIFNLGNHHPTKLSDLITVIQNITQKKFQIEYQPVPLGDVPRTYADITKSQQKLNFYPQTNLEEGILKFVDWFENRHQKIRRSGS